MNCFKSTFRNRRRLKGDCLNLVFIPHGLTFSRSSTLGSFSRMKKAGARGEGVSSGPLVILTPPSSNNSGLSSTPSNLPQNGATDNNMEPHQPNQPYNDEPQPPHTSPSLPLLGDSGVCISLLLIIVSKLLDQTSNYAASSGCSDINCIDQDQSH